MFEVGIQKQKNDLLETYATLFENRFKNKPIIDLATAYPILEWAISAMGFKRTNDLLTAYFKIHDDWYLQQGYSLDCFKRSINRIIASQVAQPPSGDDLYVVGLTETGSVIVSKDPNALQSKFTPMLYKDWLKKQQDDKDDYYK